MSERNKYWGFVKNYIRGGFSGGSVVKNLLRGSTLFFDKDRKNQEDMLTVYTHNF